MLTPTHCRRPGLALGLSLMALAGLATSCGPTAPAPARPAIAPDHDIEARVAERLESMSLQEKVGQMCELTIDAATDWSRRDGFALSDSALDVIFGRYKVGSLLNVPLSEAQPPDVWAEAIRRVNEASYAACRGITELYGVDQNHGASYTEGGTLFPQEIGLGASFDRALVRRMAEITADESRRCLIPWVYNPVMDLGRQPLWPRMYESFGEDALVNAELGLAMTRGYQGDDPNHIGPDRVAVCLKHYMGYGVPLSGKDRTPSSLTRRELRERYFEPFRRCITEGGALSVMLSSGVNDGLPIHADRELVQGWLKDELGWDGMVVTDWADIRNVWSRDHLTATYKDAIALCINAGVDMAMEPYDLGFCDLLVELVGEGRVSEARIDDAVRRILRLKARLGLLDRPTWDLSPEALAERHPDFGRHDSEAVSIAEQCIVLLRNDTLGGRPVLPLAEGTRILVTGPGADSFRSLNGGWTYSWQGNIADDVCRRLGRCQTIYGALSERFGADNVRLEPGVSYAVPGRMDPVTGWDSMAGDVSWQTEYTPQTDRAVRAARWADVIVAVVGENSYTETPGNVDDLALSTAQRDLVKALAATGRPVILVLNEGRPRLVTDIEPLCAATVDAMLPGNYGGTALARLLAGDANFSARLPFTYPKHPGSLTTYDYKPCQQRDAMAGNYNYTAQTDVLYPFGHGLSYTTFRYSALSVDKARFAPADTLTFSIEVANVGERAGAEAVLLYVSDLVASITPDVRRLRAFDKVTLQPGERQTVTLRLAASDLAFVGADGHWVIEEGDFVASCGDQTVPLACTSTHRWETPGR